jgi:phage gpG-like protein
MAFNSAGVKSRKTETFRVELGLSQRQKPQDADRFHKRLSSQFDKAQKELGNLSQLWPEIYDVIMSEIDKTFEREGGNLPGSMKWKPLRPGYAKRKQQDVGSRGILVYSGVMRASIRQERRTPNLLKITAFDPKATIHERGLKIPGKKSRMPRRQFMVLTKEAKLEIGKILNEAVQAALEDRKRRRVAEKSHVFRTFAATPIPEAIREKKKRLKRGLVG